MYDIATPPSMCVSMAGFHKYFKPALLSKESTGITEVATKEATAAVQRRKSISHLSSVRKYAAENSNSSAVRKFSSEFEALGESTVRLFRKAYPKRTWERWH